MKAPGKVFSWFGYIRKDRIQAEIKKIKKKHGEMLDRGHVLKMKEEIGHINAAHSAVVGSLKYDIEQLIQANRDLKIEIEDSRKAYSQYKGDAEKFRLLGGSLGKEVEKVMGGYTEIFQAVKRIEKEVGIRYEVLLKKDKNISKLLKVEEINGE